MGGKLKLSKCLYYILFYIFDPDGTPRMESITNMGNNLIYLTSGQKLIHSNSSTMTVTKHTGL